MWRITNIPAGKDPQESHQLPELHKPCLRVPSACCVQGGIQATTPLLLWALSHIHQSKGLPWASTSAAAKGCSPQSAEFHAENAEFHALSTHSPISNSLTGISSGPKPLLSSHLPFFSYFSTQQLDFTCGPSLPSSSPVTPSQMPPNPTNHSHREAARNTQPRFKEILLGSKRCPKGLAFLLLVVTGAGCIPCGFQQRDGHVLLLLWGRCEGDGDPTEQHRLLMVSPLPPTG